MPGHPPCTESPCRSYAPGHLVHVIHAKHVARTPWQWRDGVVTGLDGETLRVAYLEHDHELTLWHHVPLDDVVSVGSPVRVHEKHHVLGGPFGWVSLVITNRLGDLPDPVHPELFAADVVVPIVDLHTGRALPMDHER